MFHVHVVLHFELSKSTGTSEQSQSKPVGLGNITEDDHKSTVKPVKQTNQCESSSSGQKLEAKTDQEVVMKNVDDNKHEPKNSEAQ